ncbi:helix-turn-helix domain-containing protein (plasmid) [Streptosporangium sp. NBC_01495]|uniref:helix-turn-helix domain-containing protein n=1 Tax=Streptosporangium sp. NBC_01495 TaxID=2903899 RepID=UPI002E309A0A|nr:helix-turn-helix transcriptional regulator [Streptosporangium sp. NBC_01495]
MTVPAARSPLSARRRLGNELRTLREGAGLTASVVGEHLGCHASTVTRIETGKRTCQAREFHRLMELYEIDDQRRSALEELLQIGRKKTPPWWHPYGDVISSNFAEFLAYELEAEICQEYQTVFIPGLLQTEPYAQAITGVGFAALGPDQVDSLVEVRMARQRRLHEEEPLRFDGVVTQAALEFRVGGLETHRAQLDHLITVSRLPNVSLRVIPFDHGADGTYSGAFTLFTFPDDTAPDVAFAESVAGSTFIDDPRGLRRLNRLFANLSHVALEAADSLALIEHIKKETT